MIMRRYIQRLLPSVVLLSTVWNAYTQDQTLTLDASNTGIKIQPTMYGIFFEDINFAADGGIYAELVKNRSFEFTIPQIGWHEPNSDRHSLNKDSGIMHIVKYPQSEGNHNYARIEVHNDKRYELINEGFRGIGITQGSRYDISFKAAIQRGNIQSVTLQLIDTKGISIGEVTVPVHGKEWKQYESKITASQTEMKAQLKVTFQGTGTIDMDIISLFPQDTWKGRKGGLRKDIVQLLDAMQPGFLRFPGGCIVEGRTLEQRYQWKKTVGSADEREILINRWNTEFGHRPTPDYYQSFGLGYYEYFLLAEDMGAEPLPILSCGIACQFNTGELVPMDELGPYIQDALDLIEFANGDITTHWGKIRSEMGHPAPFNMRYIGIGNEQWGEVYIERYKVFEKAIKEKYPEMIIVSGSGPFPEGEHFEYGWEELAKLNSEIIDEHYYKPPQWFFDNATRYDRYDRQGPKVFAGEYAAQSVAIASPENKNNWETALSEAAFITGMERNAEVVHLTSYAPLMAHIDAWQWTPDMIWFDNLRVMGTPNYYVQKLFSVNKGTDLLTIKDNSGKDLIGQEGIYASAVKDSNTNEIIVKIVNAHRHNRSISIHVNNAQLRKNGTLTVLAKNDLKAENTLDNPHNIYPNESLIKGIKNNTINVALPPYSVNIIKVEVK